MTRQRNNTSQAKNDNPESEIKQEHEGIITEREIMVRARLFDLNPVQDDASTNETKIDKSIFYPEFDKITKQGLSDREKIKSIRNLYIQKSRQIQEISRTNIVLKRKSEYLATENNQLLEQLNSTQDEITKIQKQNKGLENLSSEFHRKNNAIKEREKEESSKRKELAVGFESKIKEISEKQRDQNEQFQRAIDENLELRERFNEAIEQLEIRKKQIDTVINTKQFEIQLNEATFQEQLTALKHEKAKSEEYLQEIQGLIISEARLKQENELYSSKMGEFQEIMDKSQEMLNDFQKKIKKMSNGVTNLKKENGTLAEMCENTKKKITEISQEHETTLKENEELKETCQTINQERKANRDQIDDLKNMLSQSK